ncbi:MAG: hypothetical protein GXO80_01940 [Chlorobi bacterium]|nr:hypothetical protein [Chlorobiota bacterium]
MSFIYPTFLFALFAVLIPVIIHLFNFRTYKTVYFSNVRFLKNIKQETKSKSNLKHLIILLMRILTIAALVFAFARPYIPEKNQNTDISENRIGIYIDNSFSTEAENKYGNILETEKKKAVEIANAYPEDVKILFLTNNFSLKHQHFVSKEQFRDFINETKVSPLVRKISSVTDKINTIFKGIKKPRRNYLIYIISDFQKTSSNIEQIHNDSTQKIIFVPVPAEKTANLFIDSVWFESPNRPVNQNDILNIQITNTSDDAYRQIPLKLFINDSLKAAESFNIDAHSEKIKTINFTNNTTGIVNGRAEITDFPVTYDNRFYFNYNLTDTSKILIIRENNKLNKYINTVFSGLNYASLKTVSVRNTHLINFSDFNVIISDGLQQISDKLNENYINFVQDGGILIIFPKINCNTRSYNKFFNEANLNFITGFDTVKIDADKINYNSEILKNVFRKKETNSEMPYVLKRVIFSNLTDIDEDVILYSEKNDKLISAANFGSGKIFIFAQSADEKSGNLVMHPLWVSLLYNMVFYNTSGKNIYYTIGNDVVIPIKNQNDNTDNIFHITNNTTDIIPQVIRTGNSFSKIFINNMIETAGHFKIRYNNKVVGGISLNYNRKESDLSHFTNDELKKFSVDFSDKNIFVIDTNRGLSKEALLNKNYGIRLYKYFLFAALLFIALEIIFIKLLK